MMKTLEAFYEEARAAAAPLDVFVRAQGLGRCLVADHLCYKCGSVEEFERLRALFEARSRFIYQSIVSSRRIALIGLPKPVQTELGPVSLLELSDQKPDGSQVSGFDHVEAWPAPTFSAEGMLLAFREAGLRVEHVARPHHTTDDVFIGDGPFKLRLEAGPLMRKVVDEEILRP